MRIAAAVGVGLAVGLSLAAPAHARPSDPGVVNYAVLGKGSVGNIVGAPMRFEWTFTDPFQSYYVDDPGLQQLGGHRAARGVRRPGSGVVQRRGHADFANRPDALRQTGDRRLRHHRRGRPAFHRVVDRTVGCSGQTTAMHLDNFTTQVWSFTGGPAGATDADWVKQEAGTDRRCFTTTRKRENVLLQAKVCQSGNGGPAVNVLAGAMQNTLGQ